MGRLTAEVYLQNLAAVREKIERAAARCGRNPAEVQVMAVTKAFPFDYVQIAHIGGQRLFGENRVQEAAAKYFSAGVQAPQLHDIRLHLIGHLQRNKARKAVELFSCVQSVDKTDTAEAIEQHCAAVNKSMEVLLELNTSGEQTKFGFESEEALLAGLENILKLSHVKVRGLMTVGPLTEDITRVRKAFARLHDLFDRLKDRYPELGFNTLSMGMSGDFEAAVEEGSTLVRLGTALFGAREA